MRLDLDALTARALGLDLSTEQRPRLFRIEHLTGASGLIERSNQSLKMRPAKVARVQVTAVDWDFSWGHVSSGSPASMSGFAADLEVDSARRGDPVQGEATLEQLVTEALCLEIGSSRFTADARVERGAVEGSFGEGGRATAATLDAANVQISAGSVFIRGTALSARSLRATWPDVIAEAGELSAREVSIQTANLRIDIDRVELPAGISYRDGTLHIGEAIAGEVTLIIEDLLGWSEDEGPNHPEAPKPKQRRKGPPLFDPRILDQIDGKVEVDLTVDATLPVIGSRLATHRFRIPIEHGTLDFKELERDLSTLEDAFIDFAVRDGKLMLERDVPIIPGFNKPILIWELSDVELALAKRNIVRLRRLPYFTTPPKKGNGDKSSVGVRRLDFKNLDLRLQLLARSAEEEQSDPFAAVFRRSAVGKLELAGRVRYSAEEEAEPTELSATAESVCTALDALPIGGKNRLDIGTATLDAIEQGSLTFSGLRPRRLDLVGRGLRASNIKISFAS